MTHLNCSVRASLSAAPARSDPSLADVADKRNPHPHAGEHFQNRSKRKSWPVSRATPANNGLVAERRSEPPSAALGSPSRRVRALLNPATVCGTDSLSLVTASSVAGHSINLSSRAGDHLHGSAILWLLFVAVSNAAVAH